MFWFFAKFAFCSSRSTRSCLQAVMDSFLSRMFWMFSWTSRLNQKPLFLEFSGFYILFSFQGSLCCLSSNFYSLSKVFAFVNTFLFFYKSTFFRNFSEFIKNLQIISFVSCFVFVLVSRTYVMIPEHSQKVKHFSKFAILYVFLWFLRIFWHHLNRAISILLFFLLQFYFLISSRNSSDRFCNRVLSGSIDFHCLPGFS